MDMSDYIALMNYQFKKKDSAIFYWLLILTIMTFLMILIGGLTRLTNSGLSMVNWRPILGFIPPINSEDWIKVFNMYKKSPEFQIVNKNMNLEQFQYIYWWEWFHRFFARCIGIFFIIPMLVFFVQKRISNQLFFSLLILFLFGFFQAAIGWWMVKSGLDDNPYVSSYRLAFHLANAVIILSILFWMTLNSFSSVNLFFNPKNKIELLILSLILLIFITIISGAFMAGSNAGQSFNTYPLMNDSFFPEDYYFRDLGIKNFFENTVAINFNHRWLATFTFLSIIFFIFYFILYKKYTNFYLHMILILCISCLQFILGILTLITNVKLSLASLHQINSMLLLIVFLFLYHSIKKER